MAILRQLQADDRPASEAEQQVLARWGGWGAQGLWQVLDDDRGGLDPGSWTRGIQQVLEEAR